MTTQQAFTPTVEGESGDATQPGYVVWHSSDEDGGPDVGITVGLGGGKALWLGDRTNREGGGQAMMIYDHEKLIANASIGDRDELIELLEHHLAPALNALREHGKEMGI